MSMLVKQGAPSARGRFVSRAFVRVVQLSLVFGLLAMLTGAVVAPPSTDEASDRVGATPGTFGVSETGAATYSLPIFTTPGVAGFAPKLSLEYNSQGGDGPLGKGWSLGGNSMITRCRAARETADFAGDNQTWGAGAGPLRMFDNDRLCLDGQRLLPATVATGDPTCEALPGAIVTEYRTEIESNQRICAYAWTTPDLNNKPENLGPRFFTVEREDGTTSWYGDRRVTAGDADDAGIDGPVLTESVSNHRNYRCLINPETGACIGSQLVSYGYFTWAQTRRMDASGNYFNYKYANIAEELYLYGVDYTGKKALHGGTDRAPLSVIEIGYAGKPVHAQSTYWFNGRRYSQTLRVSGITVWDESRQVRHYALGYNDTDPAAIEYGGVGMNLTSVQECADKDMTVCYPATQFAWSRRDYLLAGAEEMARPSFGSLDDFDGYKLGDVDGDGLQDMVWLEDDHCLTEEITVWFSEIKADGKVALVEPPQAEICALRELNGDISKKGNTWFLFDYDGDGRDDLLTIAGEGTGYALYLSQGRPASSSSNVFVYSDRVNGLLPSPSSEEKLAQLADLNGDGLLDVFYKKDGVPKARLMERSGTTYDWGSERGVDVPTYCPPSNSYGTWTCTLVTPGIVKTNGGVHMYDFNGDARSDLLFKNKQQCNGCPDAERLYAYGVTAITASTITLGYIAELDTTFGYRVGATQESFATSDHRFGDFNGDGLTDVVYRKNSYTDQWGEKKGDWYQGVNTGNGFSEVFLAPYYNKDWSLTEARIQIADVNGDGRDDVVGTYASSLYVQYSGNPSGSSMRATELLMGCGDPGCEAGYSPILSDFDGDGGVDLLRIKWKTPNGNDDVEMDMFRSTPAKRYIPRDAITSVTDGLGARTDVAYLPLTLSDQYRRDLGSRNAMQVGRGSPVQDVLAPMYVVNSVRTDSPTVADANARRTVHYRYSGAKMQAGGRGFLGFREVTAIDTAHAGKHVATTTTYRQDFPFVGRPLKQVTVVANGDYVPGPCATPGTAYAQTCFAAMGGSFTAIAGTKVVETVYDWNSPNFNAAAQLATPTQLPVRVQLRGTDAKAFDLTSGALVSEVSTDFTYDAWDNALTTMVGTYTGASDPTPMVKTTTSTYRNDQARWILGRMLTSSVAHARAGTTITRNTAFTYDTNTGLLTSERIEPNGNPNLDLRTEYVLDEFGNRIAAHTCTQNISTADCKNKSIVVSAMDSTVKVHRYTSRVFDDRGRFLVSASEPFRKANTLWGTGEREDVVVQKVEGVDKFGNIVHATDRNGAHAASGYGAMGRPYWSWTQSVEGATAGDPNGGIDSFTTYRTCAEVQCPTGAAFRVRVVVDQQPTKWTYFDKLGRTVLAVSQSHNVSVPDMDLAAVCTWYDGAGRVQGVSAPFFLPGTYAADPTFATQPCVQSARDVTLTTYDVLGRPIKVVAPDASESTIAYAGLATVTTNALLQTKVETKNALGELVESSDGLVTRYQYDPTGNLTTVRRDAGRGEIVTQMTYDTLGRRTRLVDPDAGTRDYTFNAAGEQLSESDGVMRTLKRYDFKGRLVYEVVKNLVDTNNEATIIRNYDSALNGRGQLGGTAITGTYRSWVGQAGMGLGHAVGHSYDTLGRRIATKTTIDGADYYEATQFDAFGRPYKQQDATGRWTKTDYHLRGTFLRLCESDTTDATPDCLHPNPNTYYSRMLVNARGDVVRDQRGGSSAMVGKRTYDPKTGALLTICTGLSLDGCQIVNDKYTWDDIGNLVDRENVSFKETFTYDNLNRLEEAHYIKWNGVPIADTTSLWLSYDALGNICSRGADGASITHYRYGGRAGCGTYTGGGSADGNPLLSPHAVIQLTKLNKTEGSFVYDPRGNQTQTLSGSGATSRDIKYTLWDQAHEITRGTRASRFWYGDGGVRYKREDVTIASPSNSVTKTLQVGNVEIVTGPAGGYRRRHLGGVMYQQITGAPGAETATNTYLHHDHLGNIVAVTDAAGAVLERLGYSALGERISLTTKGATAVASLTKRGFTGHEQFELLNVVHMNGRIYDPTLGRFLQVDPVIQDPSNGQNYNRYTYVWNNPLAYTDPTGMISVKNLVRQIVGIYVSAYLGSSTNLFGSMAGGTYANSVGSVVGSYVAGGKNNISVSAAFSVGHVFNRVPDYQTVIVTGNAGSVEAQASKTQELATVAVLAPDIVGTPTTDAEAVAWIDTMPLETKVEALALGLSNGTTVANYDCGQKKCGFSFDKTLLSVTYIAHLHTRSQELSDDKRQLTDRMNEYPGFQTKAENDFRSAMLLRVPNYFRTPSGQVRVLERISGFWRVRTVRGASVPFLDTNFEATSGFYKRFEKKVEAEDKRSYFDVDD